MFLLDSNLQKSTATPTGGSTKTKLVYAGILFAVLNIAGYVVDEQAKK